jgi:hypothetical protein
MKRCQTPFCIRDPELGRNFCPTCRKRKYRANNPYQDTYQNLRSNAKRRGIPFSITFPEWVMFCNDTGYLELRGQGANDMTVDRIVTDPFLGYTYGNIRMMTNSENVKRANEEKRQKKGWSVQLKKEAEDPF